MIILGIDPGQNGGFALLTPDKVISEKMPETYPDIYNEISRLADEFGRDNMIAFLEDVGQGVPGQSSKATAVFARHNGHLEMALYAAGIRTEKVRPQKWQKLYSGSLGKSSDYEKRDWKNKLKAEAQRLFPTHKITLWNADALLIANYGIKQ